MKSFALQDTLSGWKLYIDGAARGNPGKAGVGIYLLDKQGKPCVQKGLFVGTKTNNQAEYLALLIGLMYARSYVPPTDNLIIFSDSQLLVRQIKGIYRVKNAGLLPIYEKARHTLKDFTWDIHHVPREFNKIADALANEGVDMLTPIPKEMQSVLP